MLVYFDMMNFPRSMNGWDIGMVNRLVFGMYINQKPYRFAQFEKQIRVEWASNPRGELVQRFRQKMEGPAKIWLDVI